MRQKFKIVDFYPDDYDLPREFFMKAKFASLFFFCLYPAEMSFHRLWNFKLSLETVSVVSKARSGRASSDHQRINTSSFVSPRANKPT